MWYNFTWCNHKIVDRKNQNTNDFNKIENCRYILFWTRNKIINIPILIYSIIQNEYVSSTYNKDDLIAIMVLTQNIYMDTVW